MSCWRGCPGCPDCMDDPEPTKSDGRVVVPLAQLSWNAATVDGATDITVRRSPTATLNAPAWICVAGHQLVERQYRARDWFVRARDVSP